MIHCACLFYDDLLFEVAEIVFQLVLLDVANGNQMVGSLGGEILAVAVEEEEGTEVAVKDLISGMTDSYALNLYDKLFVPQGWRQL